MTVISILQDLGKEYNESIMHKYMENNLSRTKISKIYLYLKKNTVFIILDIYSILGI